MGDYERMRTQADSLIRRRGQAAQLRRGGESGPTRDCWALEVQLTANERTKLKNPLDRIFIISSVDLAVPPDDQQDALLWPDVMSGTSKPLRMTAPVAPLQPGDVVIYYEVQVRG